MTNEHHQSGRRPDKAALERLHPEHRNHTHNDHNLIDEIHQLDGDQ